jgi:hypothetical protein
MRPEAQPARDNIRFIQQGIQLIRRLDDESYTRSKGVSFRGGVGAQFRHCFDFYACFLNGLDTNRVDYGSRERDTRVATDRRHALAEAERIIARLGELDPTAVDIVLEVCSDVPATGDAASVRSRSTIRRELQFLTSHTIHHYALVVSLLALQGIELGPEFAEFGVAPSTLAHWKETDPVSS